MEQFYYYLTTDKLLKGTREYTCVGGIIEEGVVQMYPSGPAVLTDPEWEIKCYDEEGGIVNLPGFLEEKVEKELNEIYWMDRGW